MEAQQRHALIARPLMAMSAGIGSAMHSYSQPYGVALGDSTEIICGCFADASGGEQSARVYAELFAAAPDLLHELTRCVAMLIELGACHLDHKPTKFRESILSYATTGGAAIKRATGAA